MGNGLKIWTKPWLKGMCPHQALDVWEDDESLEKE